MSFNAFQSINRRCLGALKLIDAATGVVLRSAFKVSTNQLQLFQNASALFVIQNAQGLDAHTSEFEEVPSEPAIESLSFQILIEDPQNYYLPRFASIKLPRNPVNQQENSVGKPIEINLHSAAKARLNTNWSVIRASLTQQVNEETQRPLQGALLRVIRIEDEVLLATGLSDLRGEAIIIVTGIPVTNFSVETNEEDVEEEDVEEEDVEEEDELDDDNDNENEDNNSNELDEQFAAVGEVTNVTTPVRIEVIVDPQLPWPVDTDQLEQNAAVWIRNNDEPTLLSLKTGRTETTTITVSVTDDEP
ncbi:hypothetical protein [Aliikangiella maris]|uniref:Uncharacterized protein n=2 Tax=Aliikangiella maris TaxID=3162458 RepID=A0ABV3MKW9_9GAMM